MIIPVIWLQDATSGVEVKLNLHLFVIFIPEISGTHMGIPPKKTSQQPSDSTRLGSTWVDLLRSRGPRCDDPIYGLLMWPGGMAMPRSVGRVGLLSLPSFAAPGSPGCSLIFGPNLGDRGELLRAQGAHMSSKIIQGKGMINASAVVAGPPFFTRSNMCSLGFGGFS